MKTITITREQAEKFFYTRFGRKAEHDREYFEDWFQRLNSPCLFAVMDSESIKVYISMFYRKFRRVFECSICEKNVIFVTDGIVHGNFVLGIKYCEGEEIVPNLEEVTLKTLFESFREIQS